MIPYFPDLYEDELVYSLLARYYQQCGYLSLRYAIEDIYTYRAVRPDPYFINKLHPEIERIITRRTPINELIERHTMYPFYARFAERNRRLRAFQSLIEMNGNYNNLLVLPHKKAGKERYLKYCPLCAKEDRNHYGETYWHRSHQLTGVDVCPKHKCCLKESSVVVDGEASPNLAAAESEVPLEESVELCKNELELSLAEYIIKIFQAPIDIDSDVLVGRFLHSRLTETRYLSKSGLLRNLKEFYEDYLIFYEEIPKVKMDLLQIQKIFNGYRFNFAEICQLAMLLKIPAQDLIEMRLPDRQTALDALYQRLSDDLKIDLETVKIIGNAVIKEYQKEPRAQFKSGPKEKAWDRLDKELLPKVKEIIEKLYGDGEERPHKITMNLIYRKLDLPYKQLDNLPLCREEVLKYYETQEHYWARKVIWAVQKILKEGQKLTWKKVRTLTNIRRVNFISCLPHISEMTDDDETAELIKTL